MFGCGVATFALVWLYVAFLPIAFLADTYVHWVVRQERLAACDLGEVAVFGDSKAQAGIDPRVMSFSVRNFSVAGTSTIETYYAVEAAMRCARPPKIVVLTHGAHVFGGYIGFWNYDSLQGVLTADQRREVEAEAERLHNLDAIGPVPKDGLADFARDWFYTIRFPPLLFPSLLNSGIVTRWPHNRAMLAASRQSLGFASHGLAHGSSAVGEEGAMMSFPVWPLTDAYFHRTLALLEAKGVRTIYVDMPLNRATYDAVPQSVRSAFEGYLRKAMEAAPHFEIAGRGMPCWPNAYFGDKAHMNPRGAVAFSHDLDAMLREVLSGGPVRPLPDRCAVPPAD